MQSQSVFVRYLESEGKRHVTIPSDTYNNLSRDDVGGILLDCNFNLDAPIEYDFTKSSHIKFSQSFERADTNIIISYLVGDGRVKNTGRGEKVGNA